MKLHLLRIFTVVAEHMSFSRAAEALYISQPAVSKAVKELENQLGVPLFERGAGRLSLTDAGALLAERGRVILAVEQTAEEDLQALRGLHQGVLRVGASTTIATYLLPPVIATFLRSHPDIDLRLTIQNTQIILSLLLDYQLDVALVEGPVEDERISSEPWRPDELVVIAAPDHPLVQRVACRTPARQPAGRAVVPDSRDRVRDARGRGGGAGGTRDSAEAHGGIGEHRGDQAGGSGRPGIGDRLQSDDRGPAPPEQLVILPIRRAGHPAHVHSGPPRRSYAQPGGPRV